MYNLVITILVTAIALLVMGVYYPSASKEVELGFIYVLGTMLLSIPTGVSRVLDKLDYRYKDLFIIRSPGLLFLYTLVVFLTSMSDINFEGRFLLCIAFTFMVVPQFFVRVINDIEFLKTPYPGKVNNVIFYVSSFFFLFLITGIANVNTSSATVPFGIVLFTLLIRDVVSDHLTRNKK